jgi:hypothetical protein
MANEKLRAWWWQRQGLDGSLGGSSAAKVLEATGWARSVGGVGPYLTLYSRAGVSREAASCRALAAARTSSPHPTSRWRSGSARGSATSPT